MSVHLRVVSGIVVVLAVVVAAFAGGIVVQRAFATTDGVIYACKGERSGVLRVVDSPDGCQRGEEPLSWDTQAAAGLTGYERLQSEPESVAPGAIEGAVLDCPTGKVVLGGGFAAVNSFQRQDVRLLSSAPVDDRTWSIFVTNVGTQDLSVFYYAVCADGTGAPPDDPPVIS